MREATENSESQEREALGETSDSDFDLHRLDNRKTLLDQGVDPYPYDYPPTDPIEEVISRAENTEASDSEYGFSVRVAGRIWAHRPMGGAEFLDLRDDTGEIQLYVREDEVSEDVWEQLSPLDIGDVIGVEGEVFETDTGELSIRVQSLTVLSKTVVPIPVGKETDEETYYRASDDEIKYRERYLHWMLHEEDRERIRRRSSIISRIRGWMEDENFLEVSTPTIETIYGGAEARPFRTNIWALGEEEAYLRISPELYLKRYIVGGFGRVFTICKNFRNEGIDHSHNPEFTMMEWYEVHTDYEDQMVRFEELVSSVCEEVCGSTTITYRGTEIDFSTPWRRITMLEALRSIAGIDASSASVDDLADELRARGEEVPESLDWGTAVARLFEATCEEELIQPTFITDHPIEISPLTKKKRGEDRLVERFEPYAYGLEIGNAYSELTDPVEQYRRLRESSDGEGDEDQEYEDHPIDPDFVKAIGCGMPPTGGVGLGIDRLVMLLTNAETIRDIIPFPMVKPKI
jgi:lysyl-tRNA synthetase class 2